MHIILFEPEIPPNTGNIIRLCANTGAKLHLIEPLGFDMDTKKLRRAGLDYAEWAAVNTYPSLDDCLKQNDVERVFVCTTKGSAHYHKKQYQINDAFLFGRESSGLPHEVQTKFSDDTKIRIPMRTTERSINLANAVSIILFEALRQQDFADMT